MGLLRTLTGLAKPYQHGEEIDLGNFDLTGKIATLQLARCTAGSPLIWPDASQHIHVTVWYSVDGGTSWLCAGGFGAFGGVHKRRDGSEAQISMNMEPFRIPAGAKVRARVERLAGSGDCFTIPTFRTFDTET